MFAAQLSLSHACWVLIYPLVGWLGGQGLGSTALAMAVLCAVALVGTGVMWPREERRRAEVGVAG